MDDRIRSNYIKCHTLSQGCHSIFCFITTHSLPAPTSPSHLTVILRPLSPFRAPFYIVIMMYTSQVVATLASLAVVVVGSVNAVPSDEHIAILLSRQAPGTPAYDCHYNCGKSILHPLSLPMLNLRLSGSLVCICADPSSPI